MTKNEERINKLFKELVPETGKADSLAGELVRAMSRIGYRFYNDGEAEEFITQHGTIVKTPSGYWQQVPQVSIAQTYLKIMNKFAEQFGLTPSSRSRIIASDGGPADAADEMENLLGGGGS